jgi:hypothetical protein
MILAFGVLAISLQIQQVAHADTWRPAMLAITSPWILGAKGFLKVENRLDMTNVSVHTAALLLVSRRGAARRSPKEECC